MAPDRATGQRAGAIDQDVEILVTGENCRLGHGEANLQIVSPHAWLRPNLNGKP